MKIIFPIEPNRALREQWLGLMYISAVLKKSGYNPKVIPADMGLLEKELGNEPAILGYSTPTYLARYYIDFNRKAKEKFNVFSIFGGPHPTYYPDIINEAGIDAICLGEGEYAMLDLVERMSNNEPIHDISNLWVKEKGNESIYKNPLRPLLSNLDEVPNPDRSLFHEFKPRWENHIGIMSGRGCPFKCSYCFNHALSELYGVKGKSFIRKRSVDNVIEELSELKHNYPNAFFLFWDDIFIIDPNWLKDFSIKYKSKIAAPYMCNVRANLVNPNVIKYLKESNCFLVSMGLESGNEKLRNAVLKRGMSDEQILNASKLIKDAGLKLHTTNILGIPKGSIDMDIETIKLNIKAKVDFAFGFILQPYHGTEIYNIASEEGLTEKTYTGITDFSKPFGYYPYSSRDPKIKNQIENLHSLFSFVIIFPIFAPLMKLLIKLPLKKIYLLLNLFSINIYWGIKSQYSLRKRIWYQLKSVFSNKN